MDFRQTEFMHILEDLKDTARLQGRVLLSDDISEAFKDWQLDDEKLAMIHNYFRQHHIAIDDLEDAEGDLSDNDVNFLEMYLEELKALPPVSDGEKRAVMMSALAGDSNAQAKLVEILLPQVVEISRLYAGQGVLVEDLIGEGNAAVVKAMTLLECVENIDEVEGFIGKIVMDAMEEYISEDSDSRELDELVQSRVNEINDKAKELYDSLLRKVTVKEVADELGIPEEKVREVVKFSSDQIGYIEIENDPADDLSARWTFGNRNT